MPARLMTAGILAAASTTLAAQTPSRPPDLTTVLARAAAYVEDFRTQLSGIVAEETYVQQVIPGEHRELRSDLLLVRSNAFPRWVQFRDTFDVDGRAVRGREERLSNLFLQPAATAMDQARRIAAESSRFNLGVLRRTINVPLMALVFLEPDVQPRFRFARSPHDEPPEVPAREAGHFVVSTEVWVIRFEERDSPTIVRDPVNRRDVPSQGRFWIEPLSGRVLMTEMRSNHPAVRADITVNYQSEPLVGLLVPVAMFERYENRVAARSMPPSQYWRRIEATAMYGRFRRFQVEVNQHVDLPPGPIDKDLNPERRTPNPEPRTPNPEP